MITQRANFQHLNGAFEVIDRRPRRRKTQGVFQVSGHVHKLADIVVVKLKFGHGKQVFDVSQITRNEVIHSDNMVTFLKSAQTSDFPRSRLRL
jgi:hypothetical protein